MLWFFSDEKNFDLDQKVNRRNDRWLCSDPKEVPTAMHTKFPSTVMVLDVISNEGHVMPPHFFLQGLRVNAAVYIDVLASVVRQTLYGRSCPRAALCLSTRLGSSPHGEQYSGLAHGELP